MPALYRFLVLLCLLFNSFSAFAQKTVGKISGTVYSESSKEVLKEASITLYNAIDSSIEKISVTDNKGVFTFTNLRLSTYHLLITSINYLPLSKRINLTEQKKEIVCDSLVIKFATDSLAAVTVTGYKAPIVLKTDTTEFNASAFKVKENALTEDLLKKLPGIEVMKDGTVQAQGEKVTQIYVDGKPFFGNDPKLVTQNLPANIIDKIQVIDKKSEQAKVTKVEDGVVEKIINITIKKNKNRGYFGRAYAGYGTSERYEAKMTANYFNNNSKVSFVAGGNNTGRNDYSYGEDEGSSYNNYNGVSKDYQGKISYTDKWSKKFDVNANIGYQQNLNSTNQFRNKQNIFQDSSNYQVEQNETERTRTGFNGGVGFEYRPDTLTEIRLSQNANFGKNIYNNTSVFSTSLINSKRINEGNRNNTSVNSSPSFNGNLSISKRFKKERRGMFFNFNNNINSNFSDAFNISNNYFYPVNALEYQLLRNQFLNNENSTTSINSSISFSEPISKKSSINVSGAYNFNNNNTVRETFNYNDITRLYDILNDTLTNNFRNSNYNTSIGANYSYSFKNGSVSTGVTWQDSKTKSRSLTKDSLYLQHYATVVPYLGVNFNKKGKRLSANYNFNSRPPQAYQLQPVVDNTNPLFIRLGNPNLKYTITHRVNSNFNYYNNKKQTNIYSSLSLSLVRNNITTSTIYNKVTGVQTSRPINVNGVYSGYGNIGYSKPFKIFNQKVYWNSNTSFNTGRSISMLNGSQNINKTFGGRLSTGLRLELDDLLEVEVRPNFSTQQTRFSLSPNSNNISYTYGGDFGVELEIGKLTEIKINGDLSRNTGRTSGFNRTINMINADVTQYLNKKKSVWLKMKVYDLLKQNLSLYRYSGETFIEDVQSTVLTRFFLVSLNYKLAKFKGSN